MVTKFHFGKYSGQCPDNIPSEYLWWVLANINGLPADLRSDIERVLRQRQSPRLARHKFVLVEKHP